MRKKRVVGWVSGIVVVFLLSGCEMILANLATDFSMTVEPQQVEIARGDVGQVTVRVSQTLPVDVLPAPISVSLHDGPTGVDAEDLSIPAGIEEDELELVVASDAELGTHMMELWGTNGIKTRQATFELTIVEP